MKKSIKIILILLVFNLQHSCYVNKNVTKNTAISDIKLKTIKTEEFEIKYPKSWVKFGAIGYYYLSPKILKKKNPEDELNNLSINNNIIYTDKYEGIEKAINDHCNTLRRGEENKEFKIIQLKEGSKYLFKIEYTVQYINDKAKYKRVEYFYTIDKKLDYIEFQMRDDLFETYIDEAMIIINSFEPKK